MQHEPHIIPLPSREEREQRAPAYSDEALALTYAERLQDHLRYVAAWGKWLIWGKKRWRFDDTLSAFDLARDICRKAAAKCNDGRTSKALTSAHTVAAVHTLPRADRRIAATTDQWDTDPSLLNTPGGTIDLRTGETRPHARSDYITRITAVAPKGKCLRWLEFLKRITDGNAELIAFLQCACGYGLTGWTK